VRLAPVVAGHSAPGGTRLFEIIEIRYI